MQRIIGREKRGVHCTVQASASSTGSTQSSPAVPRERVYLEPLTLHTSLNEVTSHLAVSACSSCRNLMSPQSNCPHIVSVNYLTVPKLRPDSGFKQHFRCFPKDSTSLSFMPLSLSDSLLFHVPFSVSCTSASEPSRQKYCP